MTRLSEWVRQLEESNLSKTHSLNRLTQLWHEHDYTYPNPPKLATFSSCIISNLSSLWYKTCVLHWSLVHQILNPESLLLDYNQYFRPSHSHSKPFSKSGTWTHLQQLGSESQTIWYLGFPLFFFLSQIRALIFPMDYYFQIYIVYFKMRARASPCSANSYDGIPSICFQTLNHHLHLKVKAKLNRLTPFLCQCPVYC